MRAWLFLLSGLLIWVVHFFGVYLIGSVFPGTAAARWLVGILTLACLAGAAFFLSLLAARWRSGGDPLSRWKDMLGLMGCGLALPAIAFQGLPAILG